MKKLDVSSFAQLRLAGELALWRYGWRLPLVVTAFLLTVIVCLIWLPAQYMALESARNALLQAERNQAGSGEAPLVPPLQLFRQALVTQEATSSQLRWLHQKASETGLQVAQLDMRRQQGPAGEFSQLQVSLPVKGSYLALKRFCGELLVQMPSVSIDQISIKREQSGSSLVEAQISLSIWQEAAPSGEAR